MVTRDNPFPAMIPRAPAAPAPPGGLLRLLLAVETWLARRRQRRGLLELSDHTLRDIGITRCEVFQEGGKPFWRR